jgi:hypothetical protein
MANIVKLHKEINDLKLEIKKLRLALSSNITSPIHGFEKEHLKANLILFQMYGVDVAERSRRISNVTAREMFCNYFREKGTGLLEISKLIIDSSNLPVKNLYDHSTIINCLKNFDKHYQIEKKFKREYDTFAQAMRVQNTFIEDLQNAS